MDAAEWVKTTATHGLAFVFLSVTALGLASVFIALAWLVIRMLRTMPPTVAEWLKADTEMRREITASWSEIRQTLHAMNERLQVVDHTTKRTHSALRHTVHAAKHIVHSLVPSKTSNGDQAQEHLQQAEEHLQ